MRHCIDWKQKSNAGKKSNMSNTIWQSKEILIVEGPKAKLRIGNVLFDNIEYKQSCCFIKNGFNKYDDIMNLARIHGVNKLVLIAPGSSSTVLHMLYNV